MGAAVSRHRKGRYMPERLSAERPEEPLSRRVAGLESVDVAAVVEISEDADDSSDAEECSVAPRLLLTPTLAVGGSSSQGSRPLSPEFTSTTAVDEGPVVPLCSPSPHSVQPVVPSSQPPPSVAIPPEEIKPDPHPVPQPQRKRKRSALSRCTYLPAPMGMGSPRGAGNGRRWVREDPMVW